MWKSTLFLNRATGWLFSSIFRSPVDKEKLPVRLLTAATVLFLIIAGSPLADINTQAANAASNPYASDTTPPSSVSNPNTTTGNFWANPGGAGFSQT